MNHTNYPSTAPPRRTSGFTFVEALVAIAIIGITAGLLAINLRPFGTDVESEAVALAAILTQVRTKAMATTSAFRATGSDGSIVVERSTRCDSADWTTDTTVEHELSKGFAFDADWWVCFDSRGRRRLSDRDTISVLDGEGRTSSVRVLLGGVVVR